LGRLGGASEQAHGTDKLLILNIDISKVIYYISRMYIEREISKVIMKASRTSPVLMVTGPRQAGKTTVLRKADPTRKFVTLDDLEIRSLAQNDPKTFLEAFPPPVLIDEFQYAPQLLPYIKILVDEKRTKLQSAYGFYWLTGSQNFTMMENVQESLAGRVSILNLLGLSRKEIEHKLEFGGDFIRDKSNAFETKKSTADIMKYILKGGKPELWANRSIDPINYHRSYVQTYIERDVMSQLKIRDIGLFERFFRLLASQTGKLLNLTSFSNELGVSIPSIKTWLTVLERSFQVYLLPSYYRNIGKRAIKSPKVYFLDTGLLCYLLKLSNAQEVLSSYLAGFIFENWVLTEIIKSYWFKGKRANIHYWRTKDGAEIDVLYETGSKLYPIEIKLSASPKRDIFKSFEQLAQKTRLKIGRKKIICTTKSNLPIDKSTDIVSALSIQ